MEATDTSKGIPLLESASEMLFEWQIREEMLHSLYFKHFTKNADNDYCNSLMFEHKHSHSIWTLQWYPYGNTKYNNNNNNNNTQSVMFLHLMYKPNNIKCLTIKKSIECKELNLKFYDNLYNIYDDCQGYRWPNNHIFSIKQLKKHNSLTFLCHIEFIEIQCHS